VAPSSVPLFGAAKGLLCSPILIHINSASKTFNLASVPGASYAIVADDAKREALRRALNRRHLYASHLSKLALICAYKASRKWLEQVLAAIEFNRNFVNAFFYHHKLKATYTMGAAGYFLWLSISSITPQLEGNDTSSNGFTRTVSTFDDCVKNGVIGSDGNAFGSPGFIRLNLACSPETIERALNRICFC
jgi:cystathionine beta-lyase